MPLDNPILVDMEQGRKWGGHPKIADTGTHDLTTDEAKRMALDADYYVMSETNDLEPESTDKDFRLKSLAATYAYASQLQGIWKTPQSTQEQIDLKALADQYIRSVNSGAGKPTTTARTIVKSSYRTKRLNPDMPNFLSKF